jgi:ribosomal protein L29
MATAKKVKKITASDSKATSNSVADLRTLPVSELQKRLQTARADLLTLQKSLAANELANPYAVKKQRREVARILTVITELSQEDKRKENE